MQATALIRPGEIDQWDQALYAFLAEKERRSGSMRTVQSYSRMLQHFFGLAAKTPERITSPEVFSWAHGIGLSGRRPSSITIGARLACLSSFYKFLIRMGHMAANPCEAIERPKTVTSQPRGLSADDIRKSLAVIPEKPTGLRDRAIVLTLTFTGWRSAEVLNLTVGSIVHEGDNVFYEYRGKPTTPWSLRWRLGAKTLRRCDRESRCGRRRAPRAASLAARSTAPYCATRRRRGCRHRASTSSATRRPRSDATRASLSRT